MKSELSKFIKKEAFKIGFNKIAIAKPEAIKEDAKNLDLWLDNGNHAEMEWIKNRRDERVDIKKYYSEAKSIISLGINYFAGKNQDQIKSGFKFSNYAWGDDYHLVIKKKLRLLLQQIKNYDTVIDGIACVDTSPVMEKYWAQRSGIGWQGKHTNLITRDYGSWIFLGELILNIELEYDASFDDDLCGTCTTCIDSCPTSALTDYQLDSRKCISYWSIEHRGDFEEKNSIDLHDWIYGCDICQEVCPWNITFAQITDKKSFHPRSEIFDWTEKEWKQMDQKKFSSLFKNSSVKRAKFSGLSRNINKNLINKGEAK